MIKPRKKHAHRKPVDPLERIANALERIADAQETRAMSQSTANRFLEQFLPSMLAEVRPLLVPFSQELEGSGEIQIPAPLVKR